MAFDKSTRNRLASFVGDSRCLLADEFTQKFQSIYGISDKGEVTPLEQLGHLDESGLATAALLRDRVVYLVKTHPEDKHGAKAAVDRLAREQAFTILNRLAAIRMAEKRGLIVESVGKGYQSKGFKVYEQVAGSGLGDIYHRYRRYLFCLFDELSVDLGSLFDRRSPQALLFPREPALLALIKLINAPDIDSLWTEDETIGWIYQYYNDPAERKKMRDESAAPRNSRELAVRNQFFTPRYVVEFLTDNTLGRIWYEMTQGQTALKDTCRYLVKRPDEVFFTNKPSVSESAIKWLMGEHENTPTAYDLAYTVDGYLRHPPVETASKWLYENMPRVASEAASFTTQELLDILFLLHRADRYSDGTLDKYACEIQKIVETINTRRASKDDSNLSQEELLKQTVYISSRSLKDPRILRMLDPACGSMHFGLYAFDLFEIIYEEAWDLEHEQNKHDFIRDEHLKPLTETYPDKETYLKDVPRLIIENNIHGIDIDARAAQIAGVSLWLRAQKSWYAQSVKPADRPRITRSSIVCAEPMPGDKQQLREFTATLEVPALAFLVEQVFDRMQLAGEAGSLLKIEEEIRYIIAEAKLQWKEGPKLKQMALFGDSSIKPEQIELPIDFSGITNERFWEGAEGKLYQALQEYAEVAGEHGYQRRLFAEDAARGFAFIDICRKRYDVLVMNPPFGQATSNVYKYLSDSYKGAHHDIYAAFVRRSNSILSNGRMGAITSRSFLLAPRLEQFRKIDILPHLAILADFGLGVMDDAYVESAAYVSDSFNNHSFSVFDLREYAPRHSETNLLTKIHSGELSCRSDQFEYLPKARILYTLPSGIRNLLQKGLSFEPNLGTAREGMKSFDNERYLRIWWEIPSCTLGRGNSWVRLAKGGGYNFYYSEYPLVLNWSFDGAELQATNLRVNGSTSQVRQASDYWYQSGATYSKRSAKGFSARVLPADCIFTSNGPAVLIDRDSGFSKYVLLGWLNSNIVRALIQLQANFADYSTGSIKNIPWMVEISHQNIERLEQCVKELIELNCSENAVNETSNWFGTNIQSYKPFANEKAIERKSELTSNINSIVEKSYKITDTTWISDVFSDHADDTASKADDNELDDSESVEINSGSWLSHCIGYVFGRFDIRFATDLIAEPKISDPFASLPACPPGFLQNQEGLPAEPQEVSTDYPLRISWPGILVDDEGNIEDIVGRVREALEAIWKDQAADIEHEACDVLGVRSLREYFSKPAGFFTNHLKRYSKSRRQAPIYWPLSSFKGSYTLWIYYQRLTDQTLHVALADYIDPKHKSIRAEITLLRETGNQRARLEELLDLEKEIADFRDEIERIIKLPWKPNLNDGVLITAAPLWKLFRLTKWQKDLKACWDKLEKGEYDWAHLAYNIWPKRVEEACKRDRSIAIAHGLEHLYEGEPK